MTKHNKGGFAAVILIVVIFVVAVAAGYFLISGNNPTNFSTLPPVSERINPEPLSADNLYVVSTNSGTDLVAEEVNLSQDGFVVVLADANGEAGSVLGSSELLTAGTHSTVNVIASRELGDEVVYYVLYHDDGDGQFSSTNDTVVVDDAENRIEVQQLVGDIKFMDTGSQY
jgi:hypothetical protein